MFELDPIFAGHWPPKDDARLITACLENEALMQVPIPTDERMSILALDNQKVPREDLRLSQSPLT